MPPAARIRVKVTDTDFLQREIAFVPLSPYVIFFMKRTLTIYINNTINCFREHICFVTVNLKIVFQMTHRPPTKRPNDILTPTKHPPAAMSSCALWHLVSRLMDITYMFEPLLRAKWHSVTFLLLIIWPEHHVTFHPWVTFCPDVF
jgi:hypothetical protein